MASSTPNSTNPSKSYFTRTITLVDWWLVKADTDANGDPKASLGVSGTTSFPNQPVRVFLSAPISERLGDFTVETSDGFCLILQSFINIQRTIQNGFSSQVAKSFAIGFPKDWKIYAEKLCCEESTTECETPSLDSNPLPDTKSASPEAVRTIPDEVPNSPPGVSIIQTRSKVNQSVKSPTRSEARASVNISVGTRSRTKNEKRMGVCQSKTDKKNSNISNPGCESTEQVQEQYSNPKRGQTFRNLEPKVVVGADAKEKRATEKKAKMKRKSFQQKFDAKEPNTPETKTKRKIKFDEQVTPQPRQDNAAKCIVSPESLSVGRSRSGRILLPVLQCWRNQIPVYDLDRSVTGIMEDRSVPVPERGGSRYESRKKRKL